MKMLSVALAAIALGAVMVAPASAAEGNQVVEIKNVAYGECLQPAKAEPHSAYGFAACTGAQSQRWEMIPVGRGRHMLRNLASTECVGVQISAYYCDDEKADQQAELVLSRSGLGRIKFGEEYLAGYTYGDGTRTAWTTFFRDHDEQRWQVRFLGTTAPPADTRDQVVRIRSVSFEYGCINLRNDFWLTTVPCSDSPEQKFQRVELSDGRTALRSVVSGKCIATQERSDLGMDVLSDCAADNTRQHWTIETTKTGTVRIRQSVDERVFTPVRGDVFAAKRVLDLNHWQLWDLLPA